MTPAGNRNRRAIRCNDASIAKVMFSFNCMGNCTGRDCCLALAGEPLVRGARLARGGATPSGVRRVPWSAPVGAVVMLIGGRASVSNASGFDHGDVLAHAAFQVLQQALALRPVELLQRNP